MPLSSISTSGTYATPCPDMSVAKSVSVDLGTLMSVDFDDCAREIQDTAAMSEFSTDNAGASRRVLNPSVHLKLLMHFMLSYGYVPEAFGCGLIVLLVKDKLGDHNKVENYRGITLNDSSDLKTF